MSLLARPTLRTSISRLAVAGVATLATVAGTMPAAFAAEDDLAPETTGPTAATAETPEPAATESDQEPEPAAAPAVPDAPAAQEPDPVATPSADAEAEAPTVAAAAADDAEYGAQSFTVNFAPDPDAYFPPGPVGASFDIRITKEGQDERVYYCWADGLADSSATTRCGADTEDGRITEFELAPGERAVISRIYSDNNGEPQVVEPCLAEACPSGPTDLQFLIQGEPPNPLFGNVSARPGEPVTFSVLRNDGVRDPETTVTITSPPSNGTAVVGENQLITYTSAEDFVGSDVVGYTATNRNGSKSGTMYVEVYEDAVVPAFGHQKYRIGVQIESGAFVPEGTSTVGSEFTIATTPQGGETTFHYCTTTATGVIPSPDSPSAEGGSRCEGNRSVGIPGFPNYFEANPGERVVVTQTSTGSDALLPAAPQVIEPCDQNIVGYCDEVGLTFVNAGSILPETKPDTATAQQGGDPVDVDVLDNDTSEDPSTELSVVTELPASQGTIEVVGEREVVEEPELPGEPENIAFAVEGAGTLALRYTPSATFSGTLPIEYALTNSNGTTTETLTITVEPAEVPTDPTDPTDPSDPTDPAEPTDPDDVDEAGGTTPRAGAGTVSATGTGTLPGTGGPAVTLMGLAAMLLAAGAAVSARARRRPAGTRGL